MEVMNFYATDHHLNKLYCQVYVFFRYYLNWIIMFGAIIVFHLSLGPAVPVAILVLDYYWNSVS